MNPESIKCLREDLGRTQVGLAELLRTTAVTVGRWERGEAKPSPVYQDKLTKLEQYVNKTEEGA